MLQPEEEVKNQLSQRVRGHLFPANKWFKKENIEAGLDFQPRDTDILINTFPKSGTNWIKYVVHNIINRGQKPLQSSYQLHCEAVPFIDVNGLAPLEVLPDPRPMHFHLPYNLIPKNPKAKYIYFFRNPKDVFVSLYHFNMQTGDINMSFDDYFEVFMKGLVSYGDYFDHVLSWYEHRNDSNVLFLAYEQLHADTRGQVLRIAKFLGEHFCEELAKKNDLMELILHEISFENMKKKLMEEASESIKFAEKSPDIPLLSDMQEVNNLRFYRKGIVGDWKNHLSPDQDRRMNERILEKFGLTEIIDMFKRTEPRRH